jgi:hypothetical protein
MTRRLTLAIPSLVAGCLLFASAFGRADDRRAPPDAWAAPTPPTPPIIIAQAPMAPKAPSAPLAPPAPPAAPAPKAPTAPKAPPAPPSSPGFGIALHDGNLTITGAREAADQQIESALATIRGNTSIPPKVRDKLIARLEKAKASVDKRLAHLDINNLDQLGDELGALGDEIGAAFDGMDADFADVGRDIGRDISRDIGKNIGKNLGHGIHVHVGHDKDDDDKDDDADAHTAPSAPNIDIDVDDDDVDDAISDLGDLALTSAQRDAIAKLRDNAKGTVGPARKRIEALSTKLHDTLGNATATDADITKAVDAITAEEATIRKARILAWVNARRLLDADQRKRVEAATKKATK